MAATILRYRKTSRGRSQSTRPPGPIDLTPERRLGLGQGELAERLDPHAQRTDGAQHRDVRAGRLARDPCRCRIELFGVACESILRQLEGVRPEGVGLDQVRTRVDIGDVHLADDCRLPQCQLVEADVDEDTLVIGIVPMAPSSTWMRPSSISARSVLMSTPPIARLGESQRSASAIVHPLRAANRRPVAVPRGRHEVACFGTPEIPAAHRRTRAASRNFGQRPPPRSRGRAAPRAPAFRVDRGSGIPRRRPDTRTAPRGSRSCWDRPRQRHIPVRPAHFLVHPLGERFGKPVGQRCGENGR